MRYSKQRELVLRLVQEHRIHATADAIYQMARQEDPTISLGTVYRNLNFLTEQGLIKKITMPDGGDRYDGGMDEHHHCVCASCGRVADVFFSVKGLSQAVEEQTGMRCEDYQLTIRGLCEKCRNAAESA